MTKDTIIAAVTLLSCKILSYSAFDVFKLTDLVLKPTFIYCIFSSHQYLKQHAPHPATQPLSILHRAVFGLNVGHATFEVTRGRLVGWLRSVSKANTPHIISFIHSTFFSTEEQEASFTSLPSLHHKHENKK